MNSRPTVKMKRHAYRIRSESPHSKVEVEEPHFVQGGVDGDSMCAVCETFGGGRTFDSLGDESHDAIERKTDRK